MYRKFSSRLPFCYVRIKVKVGPPAQGWTSLEGSRRLRLPGGLLHRDGQAVRVPGG